MIVAILPASVSGANWDIISTAKQVHCVQPFAKATKRQAYVDGMRETSITDFATRPTFEPTHLGLLCLN
jgi:hypothetical protein